MDFLFQLDESIFLIINREWQNSFFDYLLPYWRNKFFWIPLYLCLTIFIWKRLNKKGISLLIFLILTVAGSDLTSSFLIKENVQRIRPCNDPIFKKEVFLRAPCGSGYSFTSSHAANHFSIATFLALSLNTLLKGWRFALFFWAVSIGFAQIYVGVHYPLDVLMGFLVGAVWGNITYYLKNNIL